MKLTAIEGNTQSLDGGASFGNAPKAVWTKWYTPDVHNRIKLATRTLLVEFDDGLKVLFETGVGAFLEPSLKTRYGIDDSAHQLLENLSKHHLQHEEIDAVVLSHLHFDHAGGLLSTWQEDKKSELLFPNARYIVSAKHWQRAVKPHPRDRASFIPELPQLLLDSGRLELIDGQQSSILDGKVKVLFSDGHTPGLMLSEIASPNGPLVYSSDLVAGAPWVHIPITMGYDRFPEQVINEKAELLADLYQRDGRLFFCHDPNMACGKLLRDEQGRFSVCADPL
ncbi:MAG: MBL fold metallo-hydrolase [Pseudomonadales bacterium]|nr:MBL fold metallo-hydrolase [Pseudomonadales bacterium]MCP5215023.1 MBL fold metallo-hydrolase [Pseudomonadales bacterium]